MCYSPFKFNYNFWLDTNPLSIRKKKDNTLELPEKFVNLLMKHGKKSKAYNILYKTLKLLYIKNLSLGEPQPNPRIARTSWGGANKSEKFLVKFTHNSSSLISKKLTILNSKHDFFKTNLYKFYNKDLSSEASLKLAPLANGKFLFAKKLLLQAIENVKPSVEVRSVRVAGKIYQVPAIISKKRQQVLAVRWIIDSARKRKKNSNIDFSECLALELSQALNKFGKVRQKRDALHQLAESNRAYMRFTWW